jgi:hypothetical protein
MRSYPEAVAYDQEFGTRLKNLMERGVYILNITSAQMRKAALSNEPFGGPLSCTFTRTHRL